MSGYHNKNINDKRYLLKLIKHTVRQSETRFHVEQVRCAISKMKYFQEIYPKQPYIPLNNYLSNIIQLYVASKSDFD